jgi:hypothetical protein
MRDALPQARDEAGVLTQGHDPHPAHQHGHVLAPDAHACEPQQIPEHPAAGKRMLEVE